MFLGELYRKYFDELLKCLKKEESKQVFEEIHSGICGNHNRGRNLAHKAIIVGYLWPYMMKDAHEFAQKCDKCQKHALLIHQHLEPLNCITSPWAFARWRLDIIGKLPIAK